MKLIGKLCLLKDPSIKHKELDCVGAAVCTYKSIYNQRAACGILASSRDVTIVILLLHKSGYTSNPVNHITHIHSYTHSQTLVTKEGRLLWLYIWSRIIN